MCHFMKILKSGHFVPTCEKIFFFKKKLTSIEILILCIRNGITSSRDSNHAKKLITSIDQTQIVTHRLDSLAAKNSIKE